MVNKQSYEYKQRMIERKAKMDAQQSLRTIEERRHETLNIIYQLRQNNLTSEYPAIRKLLEYLSEYVENGDTIEIDIPFPEHNKHIRGKLPAYRNETPVVVMKHIEGTVDT